MTIFVAKNREQMKKFQPSLPFLLVLLVAVVTLLPWLGLTEFNTKGEPREAVVALSMLKDGNWILPMNNGIDIPYKPPFMHWCIALLSLPMGHVNEAMSRLPSAVALIALTMAFFTFYARRRDTTSALLGALLLLTAFNVHFSGNSCRVDMMLTAFVVGALLLFYRWYERGLRHLPFWAILCMSGAVLTKGPVGFVLPCLVMGVFLLLRGERLWTIVWKLTVSALLACVLPALWYVAAYRQGGDQFLSLVMEENFGRFLGHMSYESHNHPFYYNFLMLLSGWMPWTLLALISLFYLPWRRYGNPLKRLQPVSSWLTRLRQADALQLFTWLAFAVIFVFYCIPKSKRPTYLLPCYPFIALLLADYLLWLTRRYRQSLHIYAGLLAVLAIVLTVVFGLVWGFGVPQSLFHGRHAYDNLFMMHGLTCVNLLSWRIIMVVLPLLTGIMTLLAIRRKDRDADGRRLLAALFGCLLSIFLALDAVYLPALLNTRSDRALAETINHTFANAPVYAYNATPMMHFFGTDFYSGDRIRQFEVDRPQQGVLMIASRDTAQFFPRHRDYRFSVAASTSPKRRMTEVKDQIFFYRFQRPASSLSPKGAGNDASAKDPTKVNATEMAASTVRPVIDED